MPLNLGSYTHIVPVKAASANPATGVLGAFVQLRTFDSGEFIIVVGTLGTESYTFKLQASAASAGSTATDLPFYYRKSAAAGTDAMGAVTAVAAASTVTMTYTTDSDMILILSIKGSQVADVIADKPFVGVYATRGASATAQISINALMVPRYPEATQTAGSGIGAFT